MTALADLLTRQAGVVSRAQLIELGVPRARRDTLVRRRVLVPVLPGVYVELGTVVELDSRWHDNERAADRDTDRDLDDLAAGRVTVRLRYRQVFGTACDTAVRLRAVLRLRGWSGRPVGCSPTCVVSRQSGGSDGPQPSDVPA